RLDLVDGVRLDDPSRLGSHVEHDARVVRTGLEELERGERRGRAERLVEHVRFEDAVDAEEAHGAAEVVVAHHVPATLLGVDAVRVDRALGVLVAPVGVVAEPEATVLVRCLLHGGEHPRRGATEVDVEGVLRVDAEGGGELVQPAGERPRGIGARYGEEAGTGGHERERLFGREAQGAVEGRRQVHPHAPLLDDDVEELVRGEAETGAHLLDRRTVVRRDPRQQRQQAPQPVGSGDATHAPSSTMPCSHATRSARSSGGSSTSAWSRKFSTSAQKPSGLVTGNSITIEPSSRSSTTASLPTMLRAIDACPASIATRPRTGSPSPNCHGSARAPGTATAGTSKLPGAPVSTAPVTRSRRNTRSSSRAWS